MADKKQTKLGYSTQFPGITLGTEKKINDFLQTKIPSFKSPFEIQDFTNGLYQEALKRQQSRDRADGRADMKRELIQKSETTKNNDEKYRLRKVKNTADLADLIKDFTKKNGVDIGDLDDKTTITQFAKDNPNLVPQINGFLNGNKSATSFGKEIGLLEANYWDKLKTNLVGGISKFGEGVEGLLNKFGDSTIPSSGKGMNDFAGFEKYMNEKYGTTRAISSDLYKKEKENWGNNEGLQSTYTTNLSQDLLNIGEGALDSAFTAIVPGVKAGMSAVGSTKPGEVIFGGLGQAISRGGGMINHIPGLKDFKASLPEQDQERFDAFIGNTIGMMLLGTKGKSRLLKPTPSNLKSFFVENMNPEALVQNFQENVLALPKKGLQSIDHGLSSNSYTKNKELFIKGVKPTVKGKQNITDYARFVDDGLEGIASIVKNKENLKFINDIGEESVGQLPKNLSEFSDAISQTKKKIYSEYDALAKNAGENGALVSTEGIINELKQLENNRTLRLANPGIDGIISNMKKGLEEIGTLSVEEAQTFSQHLNQNLKAFYKNGNANDIGRSTVEALVNNNLKKAIDESIESALGKGEQYSSLKKQYGQLRNIEEEVAKRALVDQRKNAKNLFDLTDIYSANQVIDSLANLNPIGLVKGGATSLIKNWYKKLNDPNVQIKKLFENIDKEISQNGKLRKKGNRWTDTKEWINEKLGRKTGNSEKTEYTSTEKSSSITSPGNIRAGLKDPVPQAPVATTFSFSQRDIKIGGKKYHHKINDNSFKTKHIFNQEGVNKQYVDNFNNAIKNGEKYALIGKHKENDVKLYLNKNFGDHFVKHGGFAPENLVETINNYDAVSVGNRDRYIFEKELPNGKWLRAITTKNFSEITFFETKNKFKGGEVIERGKNDSSLKLTKKQLNFSETTPLSEKAIVEKYRQKAIKELGLPEGTTEINLAELMGDKKKYAKYQEITAEMQKELGYLGEDGYYTKKWHDDLESRKRKAYGEQKHSLRDDEGLDKLREGDETTQELTLYRGLKEGGEKKFGFDAYTDSKKVARGYGEKIITEKISPKKLADFSNPSDELLQIIKDNWKGGKWYDIERLRKLATAEKFSAGTNMYEIFDNANVREALKNKGYDYVKFNDFGKDFKSHATYFSLKTIDAQKASKLIGNSLENDYTGVKPNRLEGENLSLKEAETLLTKSGKNLNERIMIGVDKKGKLVLEDGRHLLEAYRKLGKGIPSEKIGFNGDKAKKLFEQFYSE